MINDISFSEGVLKSLDSFYTDGRRPHAILIDGGTESERLELARLAARMTVCENKDRTPCGECEHCRKARENVHPDIITVSKREDRKTFAKDDVREMVADAYLTPNEADTKVFIISELQQMTEESQNLLLKILEEPPSYTSFVLTSLTSNAVIGTVLSRVVRLRLEKAIQAEYSEKATAIIEKLIEAVLSPYEYDRVEATAQMDGNKALTVEVLDLLCCVLRDAIALKSDGKALLSDFLSQSEKLSAHLGLGKLMEMYDTVRELIRSLDNNPNYTLLGAVLCARI